MLSGISITCFAASYAVALLLEITRLFFRSGIRGAMMLGFAGAGLFAHTVFLAYRAADAAGSPLSSKQEWYLIAAWLLVVVYLYLTSYHPKSTFGLFILPLVLGLIGVGALLADAEPFAREPASKVWGVIHGTSVLLATVSMLVGFAAGLMYLKQAHRLKHQRPQPERGVRLPSLEWLQRINSRAIVISMIMLGIGILSGMILNLIDARSRVRPVPWNDPFVLSTILMFGWLMLSSLIGTFYCPAREGRKVAYLTVVGFLFLVIALSMGLFVTTSHVGGRGEGRVEREEEKGERGEATSPTVEYLSFSFPLNSPLSPFPSPLIPGGCRDEV
jgi:ABC-type uncharacterized transport system permease subunit